MLEEKTTRSFAIGAAAGLTAGLPANVVRKIFVQAPTMMAGEWDDALAAEHRAVLKLFDELQATEEGHTTRRSILLTQITHALAKHAIEEENAIYPALVDAGHKEAAASLVREHGDVKHFLYDLENMPKNSPDFLETLKAFRAVIETHMRDEEEREFPQLKASLSEDQNRKLTRTMNREGFKLA